MTQPSAGVTWRVTQQTEGMGKLPNGQFVQGVNVTFATTAGVTGTVFVAHSEYTPDRVRQLIAEKLTTMHQVQNLTGKM